MHVVGPPGADVLVAVVPDVATVAVLQAVAPVAIIDIAVGVCLCAPTVADVVGPKPREGVPELADVGALAVHVPAGEVALVGGAGGPGELAAARRAAAAPGALVHAAVGPQELARAVWEVPAQVALVEVAAGQQLLPLRGLAERLSVLVLAGAVRVVAAVGAGVAVLVVVLVDGAGCGGADVEEAGRDGLSILFFL